MTEPRQDELDRELRDALEPLRGDPVDDWARVLDALPTARPRPLLPLLVGAVAAGLAVGWVAALLTRPEPTEPPKEVAQTEPASVVELPVRVVARAGEAFVETASGARKLGPGEGLRFEEIVATGGDGLLFLSLPGEVELRLNGGTRVTLDGPRAATLARGQVFLGKRGGEGTFILATPEGELRTERGDASVVAGERGTELVALEGRARFVNFAGEEVSLGARERVAVQDGLAGDKAMAGSRWKYVGWQVHELAASYDRREEAFDYAYELVRALEDPTIAADAERELRHAGALGAMALGMAAVEIRDQPKLVRRCWLLLADVADSMSLGYLHRGILAEDAEVRIASVHAIERITAIPSGRDESFWREASEAERFDVVQVWRKKLRSD
ncbi:MAG: hypothetical protein IT457_13545 [Planctomycetes bacterium]|nr:hypothetical protein [Planctomycetota bacterium]